VETARRKRKAQTSGIDKAIADRAAWGSVVYGAPKRTGHQIPCGFFQTEFRITEEGIILRDLEITSLIIMRWPPVTKSPGVGGLRPIICRLGWVASDRLSVAWGGWLPTDCLSLGVGGLRPILFRLGWVASDRLPVAWGGWLATEYVAWGGWLATDYLSPGVGGLRPIIYVTGTHNT
jgi:hypothetical protein